jgi:cytochrome c553|tara:strand:+ start:448 stop:792 length:345 start_codon:yes stop_codon:yes gene_type:complete
MKFKELAVELTPLVATVVVFWALAFSMTVEADTKPAQWPMCSACHGQSGQGGIGPMLTGQSADVIITKLTAYKKGETVGPRSAMMWGTAKALSEQDIIDIANYINSLSLTVASN